MISADVWQPALLPGARIADFETKETFGPVVGGPSFCVKLKKLQLLSIKAEIDCLGLSSLATHLFDEVLATVNGECVRMFASIFHRFFWTGYRSSIINCKIRI